MMQHFILSISVNAGSTTHKMLQLDESSPKAVSSDESGEKQANLHYYWGEPE